MTDMATPFNEIDYSVLDTKAALGYLPYGGCPKAGVCKQIMKFLGALR